MTGMDGNKQEAAKRRDDFLRALEKALALYGVCPLGDMQAGQLATHYAMMVEWNRRTNLTRITGVVEAAQLHYAESLFAAQFVGAAKRVLDIGSGAGFPGLPIAVVCTESYVTALEANQKKALFLNEAKDAMGLKNFNVARSRVEDFDLGSYDLLTSRALDRVEDVMPRVLQRLSERQKLLLCCAPELIAHLQKNSSRLYKVETHDIPESKSRLVAIFSCP